MYDISKSQTARVVQSVDFNPFEALGFSFNFTATLVTDRVCLFYDAACADNVGFLAMDDRWRLATLPPVALEVKATHAGDLRRKLLQGIPGMRFFSARHMWKWITSMTPL